MHIAFDKSQSHYCNKRMFGSQFDQLNWVYIFVLHVFTGNLTPKGQSCTALFSFIFLLPTCDNLMWIVHLGIT